jgi:hypothetical protein|tara:strand:+ start:161 stop:739 length:579 start_codon:yes stop_codon:yes gene_type:complete
MPLADRDFVSPPEIIGVTTSFFDGQIELDPASSDTANQLVCANKYFTHDHNGLKQTWKAKNIYLYPPRDFLFSSEQPTDTNVFFKKRRFVKSAQRIWLEECLKKYRKNEFDEAIVFLTSTEVALLVTQRLDIDMPICILNKRPELYIDAPGLPKLLNTKCFGFIFYFPRLINPKNRITEFIDLYSDLGRVYC